MPVFRMIAGPNGSGKSSLSRSPHFGSNPNLIDPDAIARDMNPVSPTDAALAAGREAILWTRGFLARHESFTVETTLAGNGQLLLLHEAKKSGYEIEVLFIALDSPDLNVDRVQQRMLRGGHDVPNDDIRRRYGRSLANAPKALMAADRAVIFDNSGLGPTEMMRLDCGVIVWERSGQGPAWVADLKRALTQSPSAPTGT